jgi:hypothetical protein
VVHPQKSAGHYFKQLLSLRNSFNSFLCGEKTKWHLSFPSKELCAFFVSQRLRGSSPKKSAPSAGNITKTTKLLSKYASET